MAEAAPALSEYEQLRVANILRNAAELKRLGLDVAAHTMAALGKQAPTARTQKRAVRPKGAPPTRRSLRAAKLPAPEYKEPTGSAARALDAEVDDEGRVAAPGGRRKRAKTEAYAPPANPSSIKNLDVDLDGLRERYLGKIIPPMGGQVKRAVMEAASAGGPPTFSRMSGIQEWRNCVMLFVNVYGEGYKNSFVGGGTEITWFAQPRQWEGTPVCGIQIFNPTSMCAYATVLTQALRLCFENSTRAIDSSKNQPNRLRFDRAREFQSLVRTTQTSG